MQNIQLTEKKSQDSFQEIAQTNFPKNSMTGSLQRWKLRYMVRFLAIDTKFEGTLIPCKRVEHLI